MKIIVIILLVILYTYIPYNSCNTIWQTFNEIGQYLMRYFDTVVAIEGSIRFPNYWTTVVKKFTFYKVTRQDRFAKLKLPPYFTNLIHIIMENSFCTLFANFEGSFFFSIKFISFQYHKRINLLFIWQRISLQTYLSLHFVNTF